MSKIKLVTFGRGGDTAYCAKDEWGSSTISGYGRPDRPHAGESTKERPIDDGTPVLDLLPALETKEGYRWAVMGPMVNVNLPDGEIDRCPQPSSIFRNAVAGNAFGTLLATHAATATKQKAGALDCVSVSEYIAEWVKLGARKGVYQDGKIVWEK